MSESRTASLRTRNTTLRPFATARSFVIVVGSLMLALAAAIPSQEYSRYLSGGSKDLSWGPAFFRTLLAFHAVVLLFLAVKWKDFFVLKPVSSAGSPIGARVYVSLVLISAIGLALRLWNLNSPPWIDEVMTLVDFVRHPVNEIVINYSTQNQHMLYSLLARAAFGVFGESIWALRLPAVLFGIGSIWTLFLFGRRLLGVRETLTTCLLMTVSYHHIWFSQNARGYTGLLMMTLLATWSWLEALKGSARKWWIIYGTSVVIGMWIHTTMAFVVASHGLLYLVLLVWPRLSGDSQEHDSLERRAGLKPLICWLISMTATLQLYALSLPEFLRTGLHEESRNSEWTNPLWVLSESIQNLSIGFAGGSIVVLGGAFVIFGWTRIFLRDRRAALLMVLAPIISGLIMLLLGHNLFPRFFFFAMGFGLLILVHGATELPKFLTGSIPLFNRFSRFALPSGFVLSALIIVASIVTVPRNYSLPKQDFVGARDYVDSQLMPGSKAVAVSLAGDMFSKYYALDWPTTRDVSRLDALERESSTVWLVYTMPFEIQAFNPELWLAIKNNYEVVRIFPGTLNGGEVFVCRSLSPDRIRHEPIKTISEYKYSPHP